MLRFRYTLTLVLLLRHTFLWIFVTVQNFEVSRFRPIPIEPVLVYRPKFVVLIVKF